MFKLYNLINNYQWISNYPNSKTPYSCRAISPIQDRIGSNLQVRAHAQHLLIQLCLIQGEQLCKKVTKILQIKRCSKVALI